MLASCSGTELSSVWPQAVLPVQQVCTNPALKAHEWPVFMLVLDLNFLLFQFLCFSKQKLASTYALQITEQ